ncbi:7024_t:CDS:1, partial [Funneliformis caledonium]
FIFGEQLKLLIKVLYNMQRKQNLSLKLDPESFCALIENQELCLQGFLKNL